MLAEFGNIKNKRIINNTVIDCICIYIYILSEALILYIYIYMFIRGTDHIHIGLFIYIIRGTSTQTMFFSQWEKVYLLRWWHSAKIKENLKRSDTA